MPSLSFFIDERDIELLVDRLNADPEIAFIVPEGLPENRNAEPRRGLTLIVEDGELKTDVEPLDAGKQFEPWAPCPTDGTACGTSRRALFL
jgi:hypothetical protein